MTSTTTTRLGELRAQHEEAQSRLARLRTNLGTAVADGDEVQASVLRAEMATLERQRDELAAALPIVEERVQEAQRREAAQQRAASARLHNERRAAKLEAAANVDRALAALGKAWAEFESLPEAGTRAARNRPFALRAALLHWAPTLGTKVELLRVPGRQLRPLAESELNATPILNETQQ